MDMSMHQTDKDLCRYVDEKQGRDRKGGKPLQKPGMTEYCVSCTRGVPIYKRKYAIHPSKKAKAKKANAESQQFSSRSFRLFVGVLL